MPTLTARPAKEERLELRLNHSDKVALEKAARHHGVPVSAYLLSRVLPEARREAAQTLVLDDRSRDLFLSSLEKPARPNAVLKAAMTRYRERHG